APLEGRLRPPPRRPAGRPSAGSRAQAAAPAPELPTRAADDPPEKRADATSAARAPDASAATPAGSPAVEAPAAAGDGRPLRPTVAGQPIRDSAAQPVGARSRARAAAPAARHLSHPGRAYYEQARPAQPERRGRGTRRPYHRSSQR